MDLFISVIIPVYNTSGDKINRCIGSILNQTYDNYEVIIVDDGSERECALLLDELETVHECIRVIHKDNEGSAVARNVGVLNARGQYIMFVDSDDLITNYVLWDAKNLIDKYNPDMVLGLVEKFEETDFSSQSYQLQQSARIIKYEKKEQLDSYINHILGFLSQDLQFAKGYLADGPVARICRTELVQKNLFTSESMWNDDTIWNLLITKNCKVIVITENIWYAYMINPASKTRKFRKNCLKEFQYRTKQELNLVTELWPHCLNGIYIRIWSDTFLLCRTYLFHPNNGQTKKEKYKLLKVAIHTDTYTQMLKNINFCCETRIVKRLAKSVLRFLLLYGPYFLAFSILEIYTESYYK